MMHTPVFNIIKKEILRFKPEQGQKLIRIEKKIDTGISFLNWLLSHKISKQLYFKNKTGKFETAGLGSCITIETGSREELFSEFDLWWSMDDRIMFFGGFSFYPEQIIAAEWRPFNNCHFTIPFFQLVRKNGICHAIINYFNQAGDEPDTIIRKIINKLQKIEDNRIHTNHARILKIAAHKSVPEKSTWIKSVSDMIDDIKAEKLQKIVLSRKKVITNTKGWDIIGLMHKLNRLDEKSFLFLYKISDSNAFLGRSPERLFQLDSHRLFAEAIAGTRPRGDTEIIDKKLETELLSTSKELNEHAIVSDFISSIMNDSCKQVIIHSDKEILKLQNLQHIITRFSGQLKNGTGLDQMISFFHPTPAVGGFPRKSSLKLLKSKELYERGWYAAPVGIVEKNMAEFTVAIRSALINDRDIHIFAGAGIVEGSDPEAEWNETEKKMDNYFNNQV